MTLIKLERRQLSSPSDPSWVCQPGVPGVFGSLFGNARDGVILGALEKLIDDDENIEAIEPEDTGGDGIVGGTTVPWVSWTIEAGKGISGLEGRMRMGDSSLSEVGDIMLPSDQVSVTISLLRKTSTSSSSSLPCARFRRETANITTAATAPILATTLNTKIVGEAPSDSAFKPEDLASSGCPTAPPPVPPG